MTWLAETPRAVVRAHLLMLPRIGAEESLLTAQRIAVGTGSLKADALRDLMRSWQRVADAGRPPKRATSQASLKAMGKAVGIGYRKVPKR
jgi:hypothetical protein